MPIAPNIKLHNAEIRRVENVLHPENESSKHPFYLKQWRVHCGLSQQALADRLNTTKGYISELERQKRPYNQGLLESLAYALMCEPVDLLIRDPLEPEGVWSIWDKIPPKEREQAARVLSSFVPKDESDDKKTG